ncbi:MAG: 50S ribosomal protein L22 [Holosporales bacterium]|jgi:large subunit ribosomal protein L22|nr:50S ribosomal protein L22 [Holosporales bacterium]
MADYLTYAELKNIRVSAQKLNLVAAAIRGMSVQKARGYLAVCQKRVAHEVLKTLNSAVANAEYGYSVESGELVVAEAFVNNGMRLRRVRARAKGRAGRIRKPFSHLRITVKSI